MPLLMKRVGAKQDLSSAFLQDWTAQASFGFLFGSAARTARLLPHSTSPTTTLLYFSSHNHLLFPTSYKVTFLYFILHNNPSVLYIPHIGFMQCDHGYHHEVVPGCTQTNGPCTRLLPCTSECCWTASCSQTLLMQPSPPPDNAVPSFLVVHRRHGNQQSLHWITLIIG